ncbi:hypothetical protein Tco_1247629 [Tanacetum coccineum]
MADQYTPLPIITAMKIPIIKKENYDIGAANIGALDGIKNGLEHLALSNYLMKSLKVPQCSSALRFAFLYFRILTVLMKSYCQWWILGSSTAGGMELIKFHPTPKKGHFARECRSGRSQGRRPYGDRSNAQTTKSSSQALVAQDGLGGYDWSNDFEVEPVNYALMAISSSNSSSSSDSELEIRGHGTKLEKVVKERDELKLKIEKWEGSSKNLTKILNSQMSAHDKNRLGFGTQIDDLSNKSETDSENRLDEYAFRNKIIESETTETNKTLGTTNEATIVKPKSVNETDVSKSKINRDEVIIEDWTSDDEDDVCAVKTVSSIKPNVTQANRSQTDKSECDFYDQKSLEPRVKNVVNTGERVVKPVWDYGKRVNHQKFSKNLKYPHAKRTFNPSPVLTRGGLVNTDRSNVSTTRSISTVRPVRPVYADRPWCGCSSHMTSNKAYLLDYEDLNGGFVAFGSDPKGVQVVLRAPRKDGVYSLDLKNIVPSGGSSGKDKGPTQEYILLPLQPCRTRIPVKDVVQDAQEQNSKNASPDKGIHVSEDVCDKEGQHQMPEMRQVWHDET